MVKLSLADDKIREAPSGDSQSVMSVRTLAQRRQKADRTRRRAANALVKDLNSFALEYQGVVFTIYGSLTRGDMHRGSDADILVDAPTLGLEDASMTAIEQALLQKFWGYELLCARS